MCFGDKGMIYKNYISQFASPKKAIYKNQASLLMGKIYSLTVWVLIYVLKMM